ncbi:MAG: hypothetical protein IPN39_07920 [Chitinophagaceae bacterium]|nr:hypothetical protein [Chitinophagaceae bacterium]
MAENVISIRPADLSVIEGNLIALNNNLATVNQNIQVIDGAVNELDYKQSLLAQELNKLASAFDDYVGEYRRKTELQLAETQIVKIRQELENSFGYYAEIRRMATGILQGVDNRLVSNDTLQYATEEVVIKAPGYWLAPALLCMAAWLRNDKETAERAIKESIRRDDYKTSLFFTLLTRRINRADAVLRWIERYFMHQNPHNLDREFIIILESVSTGVFPPASKDIMVRHVKSWVEELSKSDDFINKQKDNWIAFFRSKRENQDLQQYPVLSRFASNWDILQETLQFALANKAILDHFNRIVSLSSGAGHSLVKQLDGLLDSLVTNFDDEELPLRKKERECELVIEKKGDRDAALAILGTEEKIFEEKVDFLQMLTNAAFNPEKSGVSVATQALALSISQPWVLEGYNSFNAEYRSALPPVIEFDIDGWKKETADGSEEKALLYDQNVFYEKLKDEVLSKMKLGLDKLIWPVLILLISLYYAITDNPAMSIGIIIAGFWIYYVWKQNEDKKKKVEQQLEERKQQAASVLSALLVETVEYRSEFRAEDQVSENVLSFLNNINSEQFMSLSKGAARSILK